MGASGALSRIPRSARIVIGLCVLALAIWALIAYQQRQAEKGGILPFQPTAEDRAPDHFLVRFKPGASSDTVRSLNSANKVTEKGAIDRIRVKILTVPPGRTVEDMVSVYSKNPNVEFAEADWAVTAELTPNDPYYATSASSLLRVGAPAAWDITTGSSAVKIAILDTGIDSTHPEFVGRIGAGYDFVNNDTDPADDHGHGTLCAGVAAATGNNAKGVAGIDWKSTIVPVKVLDSTGSGYISNVARGLIWAADNGIRVMSMSLGGPTTSTLQSTVSYAVAMDCVLVAAAGNDGISAVSYPAAYPGVLAVGALQGDAIATFSNFGSELDVCAPGVSIYTTARGGGYAYFSGTSASTPYVAGLAALEMSLNSSLGAAAASTNITSTATDLGSAGWDEHYGWGRMNCPAALLAVGDSASTPVPVPTPELTPTPAPASDLTAPSVIITSPKADAKVSGSVALAVSTADTFGVARVDYFIDGKLFATTITPPFSGSWNTKNTANGVHTVAATAYDAAWNAASAQLSVTTSNMGPRVYLTKPNAPLTMYKGKAKTVSGYIKPRHIAGSYPVRIYKYRYVRGKWKYYGYVNAKAANYLGYTKYYKSMSLGYTGKWRLRAYAVADLNHAATWSSFDYVTVK